MGERFNFTPMSEDPLGVLTSTGPVAEGASFVRLDAAAAQAFAEAHADAPLPRHAEERLHCTFLEPRPFLNYLLALEALNFCFWDAEPRWRVDYLGARHDGYWALTAALHRAIRENGLPLWEAGYLARMDEASLKTLLRGSGRPPPLLAERAAHLREAGKVLEERWGGEFANLVESCGRDALALVKAIVAEFPSFRDEAAWNGRRVLFYKRAQICVADLARMLPGDPLGRLKGLERLTAFADYKVPQVMRKAGILLPAPELAEKIDRGEELPAGGPEEVELRAATIWGCEWIARALARLAPEGKPALAAAEVDYLLWSAGQGDATKDDAGKDDVAKENAGLPPYHRTRTVFY